MIALLAGICLKGDQNVCPPGSFQIPAIYALSGGFLFLAVLGFSWLSYRNKR